MQQYEQAMMAQKPKSVSGAALQQAMKAADTAASPPSVKPPSAPTETYAYCVGRGSPRDGAPGHTTHYISTLFPATPDARPTALFTTYLSHAHPQELIRGISCTGPQAMGLQESRRQQAIEAQRKYGSVVELNWNPEM
jgi:hypothetical protein